MTVLTSTEQWLVAGFAKISGHFSANLWAPANLSTPLLVSFSLAVQNELAW